MSDGSLSQDEIDALLQGTDSIEMDAGPGAGESPLSDDERAHLQRLVEEVAATQSSTLSMLTGKTIEIGAPVIELKGREDLAGELGEDVVDVKIDFSEGVVGEHSYILETSAATVIAGAMMGQETDELDEAALSAVAEAVSQITGPVSTAIGNKAGTTVRMSPPDAQQVAKADIRYPSGEVFVKLGYPLSIDGDSSSQLIELYSLSLAKETVGLTAGDTAAMDTLDTAPAAGIDGGDLGAMAMDAFGGAGGGVEADTALAGMGAAAVGMGALGEGAAPPGGGNIFGTGMGPSTVQPVQFANLSAGPEVSDRGNIGLLMDVSMELTVELGRTRWPIKQILEMGEGTIIELDKLAGEPVDILVNHKLIAKGEVVVIDENFGVRVTEIISGLERGDVG